MEFDFSLPFEVHTGAQLGEIYGPILEKGPVFWNDRLKGWIVCGYGEIKAVLKRHRSLTNGESPQRAAFGPEAMLFHDTGLHNRIRAVWAQAVLPPAIQAHLAKLREIAAHRQAPLLASLGRGEAIDLVPIFQDYTTDVITTLMDVPDTRRSDFKRWNQIISGTAQLQLPPDDPRIAERDAAKDELYDFLRQEIVRHKSRPGSGPQSLDLSSMMIAAEGKEGITAEVVIDNLVNLFLGALDTTVRWMGNITVQLLHHDGDLAEIAVNPGLLPQAADEIQRFQSVVQVFTRNVSGEDFTIGNQTLRVGDMVYLLTGAAGWDDGLFARPGVFDIHRELEPDRSHLGFGFGLHQCLGMHLARAEVVAFFEPLLESMQGWRIAKMNYGDSWSLWGPVELQVEHASPTLTD